MDPVHYSECSAELAPPNMATSQLPSPGEHLNQNNSLATSVHCSALFHWYISLWRPLGSPCLCRFKPPSPMQQVRTQGESTHCHLLCIEVSLLHSPLDFSSYFKSSLVLKDPFSSSSSSYLCCRNPASGHQVSERLFFCYLPLPSSS